MICPETNPLGALFLESTSRYGDRPAVRTPGRELTYSDLRATVFHLAGRLQAEGIGRGSQVALGIERSSLQALSSVLALTLLGARWLEFGPYLEGVESIRLTHLVHDDPQRPPQPGAIAVGKIWPDASAAGSIPVPDSFQGYVSADDPWVITTSSGTTGSRKFMPISAAMYLARIHSLVEYPKPDAGCDFRSATLFNIYANLSCLHLLHSIHIGGTFICGGNYDFLASQQPDLVVASPAQLAGALADIQPPASPIFREYRSLGAAISPTLLGRALRFFRTARVAYGATEVGPVCTRHLTVDTLGKSVGTCYPGVVVEVVDDGGCRLEPGTTGTVRIRAPGQIHGYLGAAEVTQQAFRDGWFYPGDRGYLSSLGELFLAGRKQDHLNVSGVKVDAVAVDEAMQAVESVVDAMCFIEVTVTDLEWLSAIVSIEPGADAKAVVRNMVKVLLVRYVDSGMLPKCIYQVGEIPRNPNGKPMRHKAASLVAGLDPIARIGKPDAPRGGTA